MHKTPTLATIDAYLANFPLEARRLLDELRALVRATAPDVTERISYGIPRFDLNGKYVVYIAGWKKHVGVYPITGEVAEALAAEIAPYRKGKATLQFPLGQPLPTELIRRIVELRVAEITGAEARQLGYVGEPDGRPEEAVSESSPFGSCGRGGFLSDSTDHLNGDRWGWGGPPAAQEGWGLSQRVRKSF